MGYSIYCKNKNKIITFSKPHFIQGSTYAVSGTIEAYYSMTSNYSKIISKFLKNGIKELHDKKVKNTLKILENIMIQLNNDTYNENYWECTETNVKLALYDMWKLGFESMKIDNECLWDISF
jgi:hypothetical protein